jgi:nucleotide-binding universal stress UspA family protein
MTGAGRIVVGLDGSVGSLQALRYAVEEARRRQVELVAVVAWLPLNGDLAGRRGPSLYADQWARDSAWQRLRLAFDEGLGGIPADLTVHTLVVRGHPKHVLVDVADQVADLLIIGAGRRGLFRRLFAAPVGRWCIAHATCPVITVPKSALSRDLERAGRRGPFRGQPFLTGG